MSVNVQKKDPVETITITFPYAKELNGATLVPGSPVVNVTLVGGIDANPNNVKNGLPQISGSNVLQSMQAGLDGCSYHFRCEADMSDGRLRIVRKITIEVTTE